MGEFFSIYLLGFVTGALLVYCWRSDRARVRVTPDLDHEHGRSPL